MTPRTEHSTNRRAALLFATLVTCGVCLAWPVAGTLDAAIDGPGERAHPCGSSCADCLEDRDVGQVSRRLRVAWTKAFDGDRPTDSDLGSYQDATEILDCLSAISEDAP